MSKAAYEIKVLGVVPPRLLEDFAGITVSADPIATVMRADSIDEAELHGLLDALRRAGLELAEVRREQPPESWETADRLATRGDVSPDEAAGS